MVLTTNRQLAKGAARIHAGFRAAASQNCCWPELPVETWKACQRHAALLEVCRKRNWLAATARCEARLRDSIRDLVRESEAIRHELADQRPVETPTIRELYDDLRGLESQFGRLKLDLRRRSISVVTDSIILDGVELGSFEIALALPSSGNLAPDYTVTALDPRPAAANESVTHPHVSDERLCEGEGRIAIRRALAAGRFLDFFTIVSQILQTYNPASAFVTLDRWEGSSCMSCGDWLDSEDASRCERCCEVICGECSLGCNSCDRYVCGGCSAPCPRCESCFCGGCLTPCEECHERCCDDCLTEGHCESCRREADGADGETPPAPPNACEVGAVDAVCVGQA